MLLYIAAMALAAISVFVCISTSLLCLAYPRGSVFLVNVALLLFSDGMSSLTFIVWSLPIHSICSCTLFLPIQNFIFLHSFACTMLIARRFKQAASATVKPGETWFCLYTFIWALLFNLPLMLVNYLSLHDYPDVSSTYEDPDIDDFDFCYYSSSKWAFLFNMVSLICPCLIAMSYNVHCFRTGLLASRDSASTLVIERETRTTKRYLGALVVIWAPTIIMNLLRYYSWMRAYTFINVIVILTSCQGLLHTYVYVMSYRPLRRYIKHTMTLLCCGGTCGHYDACSNKSLQEALVLQQEQEDAEDEEDMVSSPLAVAYDIHTYRSPLRSSISGKNSHRSENVHDSTRMSSGEQFVKFGGVEYQTVNRDDDGNEYDEARDSFNDRELLTPIKETKGWKKLVKKMTPPPSLSSPTSSAAASEQHSLASLLKEQEQEYLANYYKSLFKQAH